MNQLREVTIVINACDAWEGLSDRQLNSILKQAAHLAVQYLKCTMSRAGTITSDTEISKSEDSIVEIVEISPPA